MLVCIPVGAGAVAGAVLEALVARLVEEPRRHVVEAVDRLRRPLAWVC